MEWNWDFGLDCRPLHTYTTVTPAVNHRHDFKYFHSPFTVVNHSYSLHFHILVLGGSIISNINGD